jgi:hypothetical protein
MKYKHKKIEFYDYSNMTTPSYDIEFVGNSIIEVLIDLRWMKAYGADIYFFFTKGTHNEI